MKTETVRLYTLVERYRQGRIVMSKSGETWRETLQRIGVPERLSRIDEETYRRFFDKAEPRFVGIDFFAHAAEDDEPFKLFFKVRKRYLVRQLTWEQTELFCCAAGIPLCD
jgi:hypothetical protein